MFEGVTTQLFTQLEKEKYEYLIFTLHVSSIGGEKRVYFFEMRQSLVILD